MKTNRNDTCPCGSGNKYKNCCKKERFQSGSGNRLIHWLIITALGLFMAVLIWGVVEYYSTEHPAMEAYKCDNSNCGKIHYRPIIQ